MHIEVGTPLAGAPPIDPAEHSGRRAPGPGDPPPGLLLSAGFENRSGQIWLMS
jgi:hypothetical protein